MINDIDAISRNRIVSEMDKNFFVEAGAGSGKTTMLVNRMVAMVESGIDISKVCAITFTKAAAGEFYNRFQKLLSERSNPEFKYVDKGYAGQLSKPTEETRRRCAEALKNIDLCFMGTIDSFCNLILGEHPSDANIPSDASILSDEDLIALLEQEYIKFERGEYGADMTRYVKAHGKVHSNPKTVFVEGIKQLIGRRNVEFKYTESDPIDVDEEYKYQIKAVQQVIEICTDHPEVVWDGDKSLAALELMQSNRRVLLGKWSIGFGNILYLLGKLKDLRILDNTLDMYPYDLSVMAPVKNKHTYKLDIYDEDDGLYSKLNNLQYRLSMTFFVKALPYIEKALRNTGKLTFFDYLFYLRNMLKNDAEKDGSLIRYIFQRHSYYLIDEFQDTNPLQYEVFFYLTAQHPVGKWTECDPLPGSLFIVGDPKQSIYRFRDADVVSYLKVRELFESGAGEVLHLTRNFRSNRSLCEYYNGIFSGLLTGETKTQSKFESIPLPSEIKSTVLEGKYYYECVTSIARNSFPDETDEAYAVKIIRRLVNNPKFLILPANSDEPRKICYKDFMIITKSKTLLPSYIDTFKKANIPVRVEGSVPFEKNAALKTICELYSSIANPNNILALNEVLKTKLFNYTDGALVEYTNSGRRVSYKMPLSEEELKPLPDHLVPLDDTLSLLRKICERAQSLSPAAVFQDLMDSLEIFRYVKEDDMEVICYALELLRSKERDGSVVTLDDGYQYIFDLVNGETDEERCLRLLTDEDCVHIANLHKVKGLEAPIVIIAYAGTYHPGPETFIEHEDAGSTGYLFKVTTKTANGNSMTLMETSDFKEYAKEAKQAFKDEEDRLVYVAATRARSVLILGQNMDLTAKNPPFFKSLQNDLLPIMDLIRDEQEPDPKIPATEDANIIYDTAKHENALNERKADAVTYEIKNPSRAKITTKMENPDEVDFEDDVVNEGVSNGEPKEQETVDETWKTRLIPVLLGTMTHRLMEMIVSSKNSIDNTKAIEQIICEHRSPKTSKVEPEIRKALQKVVDVLGNGGFPQTNGAPQDILNVLCNAEEVYCEVPFCYQEGPTIWNGVMDVIYKEEGKWHILDYKTNEEANDLDIQYAGQLQSYIKAFEVMTGEETDAKTYHLDV